MAHTLLGTNMTGRVPRTLLLALLVLGMVATAASCGRGKSAQKAGRAGTTGAVSQAASTAPPPGAGPLGYCSVTFTGAEKLTFTVPVEEGDFDTDYWRTDTEMRELIVSVLAQDEYEVIPDDVPYLTEQAMARDPRLTLFVMDCSGEQAGVTLVPGRFSRYADVPFRPRTYEIAPAVNMEAVTEGAFYVTSFTAAGGTVRHYAPASPGQLNITAFNELQIAGTFAFEAVSEDGLRVVVQGKFDYRKPKDEVFD